MNTHNPTTAAVHVPRQDMRLRDVMRSTESDQSLLPMRLNRTAMAHMNAGQQLLRVAGHCAFKMLAQVD